MYWKCCQSPYMVCQWTQSTKNNNQVCFFDSWSKTRYKLDLKCSQINRFFNSSSLGWRCKLGQLGRYPDLLNGSNMACHIPQVNKVMTHHIYLTCHHWLCSFYIFYNLLYIYIFPQFRWLVVRFSVRQIKQISLRCHKHNLQKMPHFFLGRIMSFMSPGRV